MSLGCRGEESSVGVGAGGNGRRIECPLLAVVMEEMTRDGPVRRYGSCRNESSVLLPHGARGIKFQLSDASLAVYLFIFSPTI